MTDAEKDYALARREAEAARSRLTETASELKIKLSPGTIAQETWDDVRTKTQEALDGVRAKTQETWVDVRARTEDATDRAATFVCANPRTSAAVATGVVALAFQKPIRRGISAIVSRFRGRSEDVDVDDSYVVAEVETFEEGDPYVDILENEAPAGVTPESTLPPASGARRRSGGRGRKSDA